MSSDFGWLLFGLGHPINGNYAAFYSWRAGYEPPEILKRIATDRSQPYTHYERKRTRNRWRFHDELHGPVYKTTYVRKEYAVGSDQGGILQPIQEHSWDVTWAVPDARGVHNTLFALNPHSSIVRTADLLRLRSRLRDGCGCPFEEELRLAGQARWRVALRADLPGPGHDHRFVRHRSAGSDFRTSTGSSRRICKMSVEDKSGWIFARGGDARIAFRPLQPYAWKPIDGGGRRMFSPYLKNGVIVQVAPVSEFPTAESFQKAIQAL